MKMESPRTIAVFNHRHLGDLLGSFPALLALREKWPHARIINIAAPLPLSLLHDSLLSDENIAHPKTTRGTYAALRAVRRARPDLALCFSMSRRVSFMARWSGAKTRVGYGPSDYERAFTLVVPKKGPPAPQHDLRLVEAVGCTPKQRDYIGLLPATDAEQARAQNWLQEQGVKDGQTLIGLNMGASVERRQWGVENFAQVAQQLGPNAALVAFGGPQDAASIARLRAGQEFPILQAAGGFSPRESAALMRRCALMITGDTGPMHLALAVQTPVVALFGLVPASYRLPSSGANIGLEHNQECQKLPVPRCRYVQNCACLAAITPAEVVEAAHQLLRKTS